MVLDTGAVIRGSGARHEDRERNIRKWFVDRDLIDGAIPLTGLVGYDGMVALTLNAFKVPVPKITRRPSWTAPPSDVGSPAEQIARQAFPGVLRLKV